MCLMYSGYLCPVVIVILPWFYHCLIKSGVPFWHPWLLPARLSPKATCPQLALFCLLKTRITERNLTPQPLPFPKLLSQASFGQYYSHLSQFSSLPHTSYPHRETVAALPLHPSSQGCSSTPALKSASNISRPQVGSDLQRMHLYPHTACKHWLARSLKK